MSIDWDDAACIGHPTEWWFANDRHPDDQEAARHICLGCPIMLDCGRAQIAHEGGLATCHRYGIWGALMPRQRFKLAKAAKPEAPKVPASCGTTAGYKRHRRRGEPHCDDCTAAMNKYQHDKRAEKRAVA